MAASVIRLVRQIPEEDEEDDDDPERTVSDGLQDVGDGGVDEPLLAEDLRVDNPPHEARWSGFR